MRECKSIIPVRKVRNDFDGVIRIMKYNYQFNYYQDPLPYMVILVELVL